MEYAILYKNGTNKIVTYETPEEAASLDAKSDKIDSIISKDQLEWFHKIYVDGKWVYHWDAQKEYEELMFRKASGDILEYTPVIKFA
jgi:hypothetical protein